MSYPAYIPPSDAGFDAWLVNFDALLTAAPVTYGLTAPDALIVAGVTNAWVAAYAAATNPGTRTVATVAAKDAARSAAEAVVRPYAVNISLNAAVADLDKAAIGVTIRSTTPTPIPPPSTAPALAIQSAIPNQATLTYKDPLLVGKAKPFGVVAVDVWVAKGVAPAVDPSLATFTAAVTKSPFRLAIDPGDQGKTITVFARYRTRSGPDGVAQVGPWSSPLSFVAM